LELLHPHPSILAALWPGAPELQSGCGIPATNRVLASASAAGVWHAYFGLSPVTQVRDSCRWICE